MQHLAWETVKKEQLNDKFWRKVVNGEKITAAQLGFSQGAMVPLHHHESEQVSIVVKGAIKFEVEGKEVTVRGGEVLVIPSNLPHNALALEDSSVIEIFSPIRLDWMTGTDNYLRK
jgi:quercetin dioxygenase-like cupin family protein